MNYSKAVLTFIAIAVGIVTNQCEAADSEGRFLGAASCGGVGLSRQCGFALISNLDSIVGFMGET